MQLALSSRFLRFTENPGPFARRLRANAALLVKGVEDGWRLWDSYERLTRLSRADLAKRGLKRGDIPQAVLLDFRQRP